MRKSLLTILALTAALPSTIIAQGARAVPSAMSAIKQEDLKRDLYYLASDSMRGREAGTPDELHASMWIADQLRKIGVAPMGDNGTYFQWWALRRTRLGSNSVVRIGNRSFTLWADILATGNNDADVSGTTIWAGDGSDTTIDMRGKVAIVQMSSQPTPPPARGIQQPPYYRDANRAVMVQGAALAQRGAGAVILVADEAGDRAYEAIKQLRMRGTYAVDGLAGGRGGRATAANGAPIGTGAACGGPPLTAEELAAARGGGRGAAGAAGAAGAGGRGGAAGAGGRGGAPATVPVFVVHRAMLDELRNDGKSATIRLLRETFTYPSLNIVGVIRGTDPKLANEYLLYSSHQDHDGVRYDFDGDSTWSGADDNGSVSVALLATARAFARQPARRPVLFVYHGAEERGLLGSRYEVAHPIVPLKQIVAVLNGDMIGRNNPDTASLMGVQPPHLNSRDLVAMALEANALTGKFHLDSTWDRPTHIEGWYRRSDHLPYAEACVPAVEYSTNLHPDYHTPRDKPANIDYAKLARMAQWMYLTGWFVANADKRPALEPAFDVRR